MRGGKIESTGNHPLNKIGSRISTIQGFSGFVSPHEDVLPAVQKCNKIPAMYRFETVRFPCIIIEFAFFR